MYPTRMISNRQYIKIRTMSWHLGRGSQQGKKEIAPAASPLRRQMICHGAYTGASSVRFLSRGN